MRWQVEIQAMIQAEERQAGAIRTQFTKSFAKALRCIGLAGRVATFEAAPGVCGT